MRKHCDGTRQASNTRTAAVIGSHQQGTRMICPASIRFISQPASAFLWFGFIYTTASTAWGMPYAGIYAKMICGFRTNGIHHACSIPIGQEIQG